MAPQNGGPPPIPEDILAAADAEQAETTRRQLEASEASGRDARCRETAREFLRAAEALWVVSPPDIPTLRTALLAACEALRAAGRLVDWCRIAHDKTFDGFRHQGGRRLSKASYDWARQLFENGCAGELVEDRLTATWGENSLRDAFRWLRVFVAGLSGEGAVLPGTEQPPAPLAPDPPRPGRPRPAALVAHSDDFRSVRWFGTEYSFTPTQSACVRVLWEAWARGTPDVGHQTILNTARSDSARLREVFNKGKHPAWGTMIASHRKGTFRLAEPA
jgi:hypothetical protein